MWLQVRYSNGKMQLPREPSVWCLRTIQTECRTGCAAPQIAQPAFRHHTKCDSQSLHTQQHRHHCRFIFPSPFGQGTLLMRLYTVPSQVGREPWYHTAQPATSTAQAGITQGVRNKALISGDLSSSFIYSATLHSVAGLKCPGGVSYREPLK